jgi:crotonobetainyl-CoA:carnitine CoA-transferase CaiB-like acyl-CoA transferase
LASPLSGVLVLDLSRHLPGPLAARLLADLGARVVKVEEPAEGDPIRNSPPVRDGIGALGAILLAGVESVALDLKQPGGREALERLIARADVLIESFRPGTLARLGFPPEELRAHHPRLVIASISGWARTVPTLRAPDMI